MITQVTILSIFVFALLMWMIIGGRGYWWIKGICVALVSTISVLIGITLTTLMGWPYDGETPAVYQVVAVYIQGDRVLLTCRDMTHQYVPGYNQQSVLSLYQPSLGTPRIYESESTPEMKEHAKQAQEQLQKGELVFGANKAKCDKLGINPFAKCDECGEPTKGADKCPHCGKKQNEQKQHIPGAFGDRESGTPDVFGPLPESNHRIK